MAGTTENGFLSLVCARLRKQRPFIPAGFDVSARTECVDGLPFMNLWFRTRGCTNDRQGACTFCNYGASSLVCAEDMVSYVRKGLSSLNVDENTILLATPSGSMFDDREVPPQAREAILQLVRDTKCRSFLCETRVETLTEETVSQYAAILDNKIASIEIGLESSNPWVLKYCINKNLSLDDYRRAIQLLHKYHLGSSTTVMLGSAFLSPREAIEDTVKTVRWAFEQGTERACIFPAHVKRWTLLEWLWENNLYLPPSLWSLVEVLARLGPELSPRVYTAWYKVYDQESEGVRLDPVRDLEFLCSPTTCDSCQPRVMELLDMHRAQHSFAFVEQLSQIECVCKRAWKAAVETAEVAPLRERVAQVYEIIGSELLGSDWWARHGKSIIKDVGLP